MTTQIGPDTHIPNLRDYNPVVAITADYFVCFGYTRSAHVPPPSGAFNLKLRWCRIVRVDYLRLPGDYATIGPPKDTPTPHRIPATCIVNPIMVLMATSEAAAAWEQDKPETGN